MDHSGILVGEKLHYYLCCRVLGYSSRFHLHVVFVWAAAIPARQLQMHEMNNCF